MPTPPWDLGDGHVPGISMVILNAVYKIKVFFRNIILHFCTQFSLTFVTL